MENSNLKRHLPIFRAWEEVQEHFPQFIDESRLAKLQQFYELLVETNKNLNLTRLIELPDFLTFHLVDSLLLLEGLEGVEGKKGGRYLDIGSGCGVPGLLLAICAPDICRRNLLCESVGKKARFLSETCQKLTLKDIQVLNGRAEGLKKSFDLITARAVLKGSPIFDLTAPLLNKGGHFLWQGSLLPTPDDPIWLKLKRGGWTCLSQSSFTLGEKERFIGYWRMNH